MSNNICVIGAGYWGKNHIRTLYELGLLGGIVESDSTVLKRFSDQYPEVDTYDNIDDALQNENNALDRRAFLFQPASGWFST